MQRWTAQLQFEKHTDRVRKRITNQTMLIMPEVMGKSLGNAIALSQMRTDRSNQFPPPATDFDDNGGRFGLHMLTSQHDQFDMSFPSQVLLADPNHNALVGRNDSFTASDWVRQAMAMVRESR